MQHVNEKLWNIVEPVVNGLGYDLIGIEHLQQGRFSVLRVFADTEKGINLDQCAEISHQLGTVLDVEEAITGAYNLEVSSPGLDRRIFRVEDFGQYLDEDINLRLTAPVEGRRKYKGQLVKVDKASLTLLVDGKKEQNIELNNIEKANVIAKINFKK